MEWFIQLWLKMSNEEILENCRYCHGVIKPENISWTSNSGSTKWRGSTLLLLPSEKKHLQKATKHRSLTARIIQAPWFILILFNKNSLKGTHPADPAPKRPWTLSLGEFVFTLSTFTTVLEGSPFVDSYWNWVFWKHRRITSRCFIFVPFGQQFFPLPSSGYSRGSWWLGWGCSPKSKAIFLATWSPKPQYGGEQFLGESDPQKWPKHFRLRI